MPSDDIVLQRQVDIAPDDDAAIPIVGDGVVDQKKRALRSTLARINPTASIGSGKVAGDEVIAQRDRSAAIDKHAPPGAKKPVPVGAVVLLTMVLRVRWASI